MRTLPKNLSICRSPALYLLLLDVFYTHVLLGSPAVPGRPAQSPLNIIYKRQHNLLSNHGLRDFTFEPHPLHFSLLFPSGLPRVCDDSPALHCASA
jgi:hypothetical protein